MKNKSLWILAVFFCFALFGTTYINNHLDKLFALKANRYYKKNDIKTAQLYFEKAFALGLNDPKAREIYINSIINSPLTTKSQEKLAKFVESPQNDLAYLRAENFIYEIRKEIHRKYPENYIANATYNQKIIRWTNKPITYGFIDAENVPNYIIKEIENAFSVWEDVLNNQIFFAHTKTNPDIIIKFSVHNPANVKDHKFVVAYTTPVLELNKLKNMKIVFYTKDPYGKFFTENQIFNTALHETAHALGFMGHSNDKRNLMYLTKDTASVLNNTREQPTLADIYTIKLLYKIKPDITNVDNTEGEYIPFLVLGKDDERNSAKLREAKHYVKKAPEITAGYIDLAEGYVAKKDYAKAIKSLEKALQIADNDEIRGMIYYNLAVSYFYIDQLEIAREYLEKSIQIKDNNDKHYLLGEIYVREGNFSDAIKIYSNLTEKDPQNIEYTIALTNIYVLKHDYLKARKILNKFFKANPKEIKNPRFEPYGILKIGL